MGGRILFVMAAMTYGGAAKVMAFVANRLAAEGHDVSLLAYESTDIVPTLAPEIRLLDCPRLPSRVVGLRRLLQALQVRRVMVQVRPDVAISFLTYSNMISILATRGTGIPVIISERGDPYVLQSWFTRLRDFLYHFADGCVFQTTGAQTYYGRSIQSRSVVIPNPVLAASPQELCSRIRQNMIVSVGRFELKQKRQDILISAFARVAKKHPDTQLVLYGDGEDETAIRQLVAATGLGQRIFLAGVTKNVEEAIQNARMFVLCSDYEGIPNALIEAMSVGLPCISTDCSPGGAAELIQNMKNGILVRRGSVDELAVGMEFMLEHPQQAELMAQNAQKIVNDLEPQVIFQRWNEYIARFVSANASGRPA